MISPCIESTDIAVTDIKGPMFVQHKQTHIGKLLFVWSCPCL